MLQIQLLGDFALIFDGAPVTVVNTARLQSLLAYLVLHRDAPQSRRHLAFLFWPDSSEAQALTNLRKSVHQLRHALPQAENLLLTDTKTVQWNPAALFTLDVTEFQSAVERGLLKEAVGLYRGDLLPGCYDEWIGPEREHLQQVLLDALEKLTLQYEAAHNYTGAIGCAQRLVQRDPLREESYRHLMHLYALNDDRAAALHVYHTCVTTLERELAVEPSPITRQMYERLLNLTAPAVPSRAEAAVLPLVGREREWTLVRNAWRDAATRRPHLILIRGEAGIGKTRLAEELIEWVSHQGFTALTAHCYAAEAQMAYAPVVEWLRAHPVHGLDDIWLTELARLMPEILIERPDLPQPAPLTEDWQRLRLFKALAYALLKGHASLLLHIDDLQWCDRDTLEWLRYLLQSHLEAGARPGTSAVTVPLLVVGTLRAEEIERRHPVESLLDNLRHTGQVTEVELEPLTEQATLTLAQHVSGQTFDATLAPMLYQGTEGHPLFVIEMVRAGAASIRKRMADHAYEMIQTVQTLPTKVQQVIQARLAQLSATAQDLVGLAATVGRAFTFDVIRHASPSDEDTLVHGLDELWQRRIIREQGSDAYDFSHDKIREVAYTNLSSARRRLLHRQVAVALETVHASNLDAVSGQIARHYEVTGQLERAIEFYRRAAEAAQRIYANEDSVNYYQHLLNSELTRSLSPDDACKVMLAMGEVWRLMGRWAQAADIGRQALAQAEAAGNIALQGRAQRAIADILSLQGFYDQALQELGKAQDRFQAVGDLHGVVLALWTMGETYWHKGDHLQALAVLDRQLEIATEINDQRGMCDALGTMGIIYWGQGDLDQSQDCCERSIAIAETIGYQLAVGRAANTLSDIGSARHDYPFALKWCRKFYEVARQIDDRQGLAWAIHGVAIDITEQGYHQRALAYLVEAWKIMLEIGDTWSMCVALSNFGSTFKWLGHPQQAKELYWHAITIGKQLEIPGFLSAMMCSLIELLLEQPQLDEADILYHEAQNLATSMMGQKLAGRDVRFKLAILGVRLRHAQGRLTALQAVMELERLLDEWPAPEQQAALHYEMWRLDRSLETYRTLAAEQYRLLCTGYSPYLFRMRYHELTGESLPVPPPLPDLPGIPTSDPIDLQALAAHLKIVAANLVSTRTSQVL